MMKTLIGHEINKFFKSKKNLLLIGLFFLFSITMIFFNIYQSKKYMDTIGRGHTNSARYSSGLAATLTNVLEEQGYVEDESPEMTLKRIDYHTQEANYLNSMGLFYSKNEDKDFKYINMVKSKLFASILTALEEDTISIKELRRRGYDLRQLELLSKYTKYLVDVDVQPMLNIYKPDGGNGMVMFLKGPNLIIFIFLIVLLSVDVYLKEVSEGSYKLLFTQPYERKRIFFSKAIVTVGVSMALILVSAVFNFIVLTLMGGVGDWQYPMMSNVSLMGLSLNSLTPNLLILPLWKYVLMGFILLIPLTLFTVMLIFYVSIATDSNNKTIGIIIILIFMAFVFSTFLSEESVINLWYPPSYIFMEKVISVENRTNYGIGILLNSIGTIILFFLSYNKFKSKDFLGAVD